MAESNPAQTPADANPEVTAILGVARTMGQVSDEDAAIAFAKERGWITAEGEPTATGREIVESLSEQTGTRTAYGNF